MRGKEFNKYFFKHIKQRFKKCQGDSILFGGGSFLYGGGSLRPGIPFLDCFPDYMYKLRNKKYIGLISFLLNYG